MLCLFQDWNFHHYLNSNSGLKKSFTKIFRKKHSNLIKKDFLNLKKS
jgi:hypothetical protein